MSRILSVTDALLLLVALIWGSSYAVAKYSLSFYPVLGFLAVRFGLTALVLAPLLLRAPLAAWRSGVPLGGVLLAIFLAETYGVLHTRASNAAFLISLCVLFTPFVQWWMFGQRPTARLLQAVGLSLVGTWLLSGGVQMSLNLGDGLILLAAVLRAVQVCLVRRYFNTLEVSALSLTAVQALTLAVCAGVLALCWLPATELTLPREPGFWLGAVYLVAFATLFAFWVQNWALARTSPSRVGLLMGTEPVFGALIAMAWLGESLPWQGLLGGGLIVAATFWGRREAG